MQLRLKTPDVSRRGLLLGAVTLAFLPLLPRGSVAATPPPLMRLTTAQVQYYALIGLQGAQPSARWQRIDCADSDVIAISAEHPKGLPIGWSALFDHAAAGLGRSDWRYAGRTVQGAFDGHGLVGAMVV